jgi:hypothetical protein
MKRGALRDLSWFEKARLMYEQGKTPAEIGRAVRRSRVAVRKALLKRGVQLRTCTDAQRMRRHREKTDSYRRAVPKVGW